MKDNSVQDAVDNISMIKDLILKTRKSFTAFSKIFIFWGILFIFQSLFAFVVQMNPEMMMSIANDYPLFGTLMPMLPIAIVAGIVYYLVASKVPLVAMEKHLMILWVMVLILNIIPNRFNIVYADANAAMQGATQTIEISNYSSTLFSLAIALVITALLTEYKHLMYLGSVYIIISVLYAYTRIPALEMFVSGTYFFVLPFTFLFTGLYLKRQQVRWESNGYQLDS